jgi:hypothetical protein
MKLSGDMFSLAFSIAQVYGVEQGIQGSGLV